MLLITTAFYDYTSAKTKLQVIRAQNVERTLGFLCIFSW